MGRAQLRWNSGSGLARANPAAAQSPVSLVAADGESLSGNVQSNFAGNGFYARNSLTRARDWSGPNPVGGTFTGFDDPNFVRIAIWLADFVGTGFYSRAADLAVNGFLPEWTSVDPVNNVSNGVWCVVTADQYATQAGIPSGGASAVVGASFGEEPSDDTAYTTIKNDAASWLSPLSSSARFHLYNYTHHLLNPSLWFGSTTGNQAVSASDPTPPTVRKQITTCDQYWFASQNGGTNDGGFLLHFQMYTHLSGNATTDQVARGSNYGSMMDAIRAQYASQPSSPFGIWTENGAPFNESFTHEITPAELQWAIWSAFVHGARSINYFNHTFRAGDPTGGSNNNFNNDYYGGPGITGTGIYAKAKEINTRALQIGPVINGPFDGYFCWGTTAAVSTSGFLTAVTSTNARSAYAGVDASCRWNPLNSKHYILATTRESLSATNVPVTCRMVDQGQTTAVPVFGGSPISVTRGGGIPAGFCEFSDTFAAASDYKVWRID